MLHGLSASPLQFVAFGRMLHERAGANVYLPVLPHHVDRDRLSRTSADLTAESLIAFADDVVTRAAALGDRIVVTGFSLGGLLAAWIAQRYEVERAVPVAPYLGVRGLPQRFAGTAARYVLRRPNQFLWWDPILRERLGPDHGYPHFATHAAAQAYRLAHRLLREARSRPPRAQHLTVVINASEMAVNNRTARRLASAWHHQGADVSLRRIRGLPLSHDIIEPERMPRIARGVYAKLIDIVDR